MSENDLDTATEQDTPAPDDAEAEAGALAVDMGGNKMVPLSALIAEKKNGKALRDKVKELEPIAARAADVDGKLQRAQPIIDAILTNPKLRAEALRAAGGTRTSGETTDQPDDAEANAVAEEFGFYLSDGVTPDAARGQRVLARMDARSRRTADDAIRPLAGITLSTKAETNIQRAMAATDDNGVPWATRESIEETARELPPALLANEAVSRILLTNAIGIDKMKGRSPKAPDEPLYLESAAGRGRSREAVIDPDMKAFLAKNGISEKDYNRTTRALEDGVASRRGIPLGGK